MKVHLTIFSHWRKFKCWMQNIVLHEDSNHLKLSNKFIMTCQHINKDLNQFYLHLFNLEIQLKHTINMNKYQTCLVKSLQNLINQQD